MDLKLRQDGSRSNRLWAESTGSERLKKIGLPKLNLADTVRLA